MKTISWTRKVKLYQPGLSIEQIKAKYRLQQVYKLSSNENPLLPPSGLLKILRSGLRSIHRYPLPMRSVAEAAGKYYGVDSSWVVLGNGSSELIDKLMQAYAEPGQVVLVSENSFPLYEICAPAHRLSVLKANMGTDRKVSVSALLDLLKTRKNIRLIFISNPNNPTGTYLNHSEVEKLLKYVQKKDILLVLDEAYREYSRAEDFPDGCALLRKYDHLVVVRSLSKVMGLAGLRAGVLLARPECIQVMKKALCPFNVNALAARAMQYCFSEPDFQKHIRRSQKQVWKGLDYFYQELRRLGCVFYPSQANFVLFSPDKSLVSVGRGYRKGADKQPINKQRASKAFVLFETLLKKGIILRPLPPTLENYLRMSVGLMAENQQAIKWIEKTLKCF